MSDQRQPAPLPYDADALEGLSGRLLEWHHDAHYRAYVTGRNAADKRLAEMRAKGDFGDVRAIKRSASHNANGAILHEIFFAILGGDGAVDPDLPVHARIEEDFGSHATWLKELKAVAAVARGWAVTCWEPFAERLEIVLVDAHDVGGLWGGRPILPIDVWEHAYYPDFGPNRAQYVEAVLGNLNWVAVDELYRRAVGGEA